MISWVKVFAANNACVGWYRNEQGVNWTLWPKDLVRSVAVAKNLFTRESGS